MKIKAVLDTNVLISGIFWKGAPFEVFAAWQKRRFLLVISPPILDEYRRVLDEMTKQRPIPVLGSMVTPIPFPERVCSDPDDAVDIFSDDCPQATH